jgi:protein-disulfide isomerase
MGKDHILGSHHALVTFLEYGDYESHECSDAYFTLERLLDDYEGDLRLIYRHFPLRQIHPRAERAAEAAEAAGAQGCFWEMHHLLFENPGALEPVDLMRYASALDLDVERFAEDLESRRFASKISEDFRNGIRGGVTQPPAFFLNGQRYIGSVDYRSLKAAIQALIDQEVIRRAI